jgi:hypothetical protein
MIKKILYVFIGASLMVAGTAYAVQITVPSATSQGQTLTGLSTGNYQATSTVRLSPTGTLGLQNGFISNASSTITSSLFDTLLSGGFAYIGQNGQVLTAASSSIFGFIPDSFAYPFINNATTSGLLLLASTTIGDGISGLTISGTATTTGIANFYGGSVPVIGSSGFGVTIAGNNSVNASTLELWNTNSATNETGPVLAFRSSSSAGGALAYIKGSRTNTPGAGDTALEFFNEKNTIVSESARISTLGNLGVGTTSPFARLSIQGNPTDSIIATTLFAIGSSTSAATTTLFSVDNTGLASTTKFIGSGLTNCNTGNVLTWSGTTNLFGCAVDAQGSGTFPFTPQTWGNSTSTLVGFFNGLAVGTTTPTSAFVNFALGSTTNVLEEIYKPATTTNMTIGMASGTVQQIDGSTSAFTLTVSAFNLALGQKKEVIFCNPGSQAGGGVTWAAETGLHLSYNGGTAPGGTTQAGTCDKWYLETWKPFGSTTPWVSVEQSPGFQ